MGGIDGEVQGNVGGRRFHRVMVSLCVLFCVGCHRFAVLGGVGGGGVAPSSCRV